MVIDLFYESSSSLKDKRHVVASLKEKVRQRFNVSIIESDFQGLWQKIQVSIAMLANKHQIVDRAFTQIESMIFSNYPVQILDVRKEFM